MSKHPKLPTGIMHGKDGRYRVRISYEGRQQSVGYFDTLQDAKAALAIAKADAVRGIFIPPAEKRRAAREAAKRDSARSLTFGEWAKAWLAGIAQLVEAGQRSQATYRECENVLGLYVLPVWEKRPLVSITPKDVDSLLAKVLQTKGAKTRNKVLRTVRALFNAAIEQEVGDLTASPIRAKMLKTVVDERPTPTPAQVKALAEAMPKQLALSVHLAAWCALRQGEMLGLQRRDLLELETGSPKLRVERQWSQKKTPPGYAPTKGKASRAVSIPSSLVPLIREHLEHHVAPAPESPLFESPITPGKPLSQTNHNMAWKKAREAVGLPHLHFHDLRHTGLTFYAQQGATVKELMERGGHKNIEVALRYQHAASERARALADALPVQV